MIVLRRDTQRLIGRIIMLAVCYLMGSPCNPLQIAHILVFVCVDFTY